MFKLVPSEAQQPAKNWFYQVIRYLSINEKITFGYALTLGIAILGTMTGFVVGDRYQQQAKLKEQNAQEEIRQLQRLQTNLLQARAHQQNFITSVQNREQWRKYYADFIEHSTEFDRAWSVFKASQENPKRLKVRELPAQIKLFKSIVPTYENFIEEYFRQSEILLKSMNSDDLKPEEIEAVRKQLLALKNSTLDLKLERFIDELNDLTRFADEEYERAKNRQTAANAIRLQIITSSILISVAVAIALALCTSHAIARPIQDTTKVARRVTQEKNFSLQAPVTTEDEVGALATSLNHLILLVNQLLEEQKATNQTQLLQSQKMSSLGRMIAGVAHEINDPVNFIYGNSRHGIEYVKDLLELVEIYASQVSNPPQAVREKLKEIEFDFLKEDLPKLLQSVLHGAERTVNIIYSLKDFSRLDESIAHPVDLHRCIDSTLLILNSRINQQIVVIRNYGDIPEIKGYAGLLYQVFMNLLSNAIDTLDYAGDDKRITIATKRQNDDWAVIKIADNGCGIPPEHQAKIFDAFFTTKSTGERTGLGLAISHQIIVEKHGGKITCKSEVGVGTEFTLTLPIKQQSLVDLDLAAQASHAISVDWESGKEVTGNSLSHLSASLHLPLSAPSP